MNERLINTGKSAKDPRRTLFLGVETGILWDLRRTLKPLTYTIIGRAQSDRRRVQVQDSSGGVYDLSAEKARLLVGVA